MDSQQGFTSSRCSMGYMRHGKRSLEWQYLAQKSNTFTESNSVFPMMEKHWAT
jgi:hypothetical protein